MWPLVLERGGAKEKSKWGTQTEPTTFTLLIPSGLDDDDDDGARLCLRSMRRRQCPATRSQLLIFSSLSSLRGKKTRPFCLRPVTVTITSRHISRGGRKHQVHDYRIRRQDLGGFYNLSIYLLNYTFYIFAAGSNAKAVRSPSRLLPRGRGFLMVVSSTTYHHHSRGYHHSHHRRHKSHPSLQP